MPKLMKRSWLLSIAASMGVASTAVAQNPFVEQADAVFDTPAPSFVETVSHECTPGACDTGLGCAPELACDDMGCDSVGCLGHDGFDLSDSLFGEDSAYDIGGWVQMGYTNRSTGLFNTNPDRFNFHQVWLYAEKAADGSEGFDWGFRADLMYGTDADDTQAFGNPPGSWDYLNGWDNGGGYGWAMPQLYGEVAIGDLSVIAGHFYTLLGYEVVTAPDNFFFSHAFTMYNSEAFTHTGVLATYSAGDNVTLYGGWTLGWDTGFDQFNGGNSFLGGASVNVTDSLAVTYILTAGNLGAIGDGYTHSIVADWGITDNLNYVVQSDLVDVNSDVLGDGGTSYHTIGINQYLIYSINDVLGVGGRFEWWKANGVSYNGITGGVNIRPCDNLVIRPEVRYQWSPAEANSGGAVNPVGLPVDEGAIFGIDAILTF